eukprot:Lithocolla_globosa_v1_NODE_1885_length_2273_cov_105.862940.p2 type:complete len:210 gc:universal NODE_1885_length_2273_cov_105.862940:656-27(-)
MLSRNVPPGQLKLIASSTPFGSSFEVESVLAHRGPTPHEYKVRWRGRPVDEDEWVPFANFDDVDCITTYWNRRGGKKEKENEPADPARPAPVDRSATNRGNGKPPQKPAARAGPAAPKSTAPPRTPRPGRRPTKKPARFRDGADEEEIMVKRADLLTEGSCYSLKLRRGNKSLTLPAKTELQHGDVYLVTGQLPDGSTHLFTFARENFY